MLPSMLATMSVLFVVHQSHALSGIPLHDSDHCLVAQTALELSVAELEPHEHTDKTGAKITWWIEDCTINRPFKGDNDNSVDARILPRECRERRLTYTGAM